ncbi:MAG TPA: V-type ATPase subunit subunit G family protein [Methanoregula sp.]|nr:V-type ATPase subunit subunit G family protein [Methanoregula sp.]
MKGGEETDTERTLLQQIRDKEQELGSRIEGAKKNAAAMIAAAQSEADDLVCTAESMARSSAEKAYWTERGKTETGIAELKRTAEQETADAIARAERNIPAAADAIVKYVTGEQ